MHSQAVTPIWSDLSPTAKADAVRALVATGLTARAVSKQMGTTKNAVISVCNRRKIALGFNTPTTTYSARVEQRSTLPMAPAVSDDAWAPLAGSTPSVDPTRKQCCWPVGREGGAVQLFCGMPKQRGSYCAAHAKRAFAPRQDDVAYSEKLMGPGRSVPAEISIEEAVVLVRGRVKAEVEE